MTEFYAVIICLNYKKYRRIFFILCILAKLDIRKVLMLSLRNVRKITNFFRYVDKIHTKVIPRRHITKQGTVNIM